MTIAGRLRIAVIVPVLAALLTVAALLWSHRATSQVQQKLRTARQLATGVGELNDLGRAYLLHRDERPVQQFHAAFADLRNLLAGTRFGNPAQDRLRTSVGDAVGLMGDAFDRLTSETARSEAAGGTELAREAEERLTGQALVRSREALSDVARLEGLLEDEAAAANRRTGFLVMALVLAMAAVVTVILVPLTGGITRSLARLTKGVVAVGSGDLSHRVGIHSIDEIGDVSRSFDMMAGRLQETIVSRNALAAEVEQRKQAEAGLRESEEKYSALFDKSPFAVALTRMPERTTVAVNDAFLSMFGYTREELIGKASTDLRISDLESQSRVAEELQRHGAVKDFKVVRTTKSGERRDLALNLDWVTIGGARHVLTTIRDLTARKRADEALRESEEKFAKAFQSAPYALAISRLSDGLMTDVNDGFVEMSGYSRDEAVGKTSLEIGFWEDPTERAAVVEELSKAGHVRNREFRFRAKGGRTIVGLFSADVLQIAGQPCILSSVSDITERKRVERELVRLASFPGQNPSPVVEIELSSGDVKYANACAERLFPDLIQRGSAHPLLAGALELADAARAKGGPLVREVAVGDEWYVETLNLTPDEQRLRVYAMDITERKRAEEELRRGRARLEAVLAGMTDARYVLDSQWRIVDINPKGEAYFGRTRAELVGNNIWEFYPETVGSRTHEELHRAMATGLPVHFESVPRPGQRSFEVHAYPEPEGLAVYLRDITERKRAEERIASQLAELQRWQAVMLDREDRVMTLKREINELLRRQGEPIRYASQAKGE